MPSRINIGPENGPYVELDEENGEFVIRVPVDEVNFDQSDLRNVKDFTAESVSTGDATINGTPENDPRELIGYVQQESVGSFSETITGLDATIFDRQYVIEILRFEDSDGAASQPLKLSFSGSDPGTIDYLQQDDAGAYSQVTGADVYELITTPTTDDAYASGVYTYIPSRFGSGALVGDATEGRRAGTQYLIKSINSGPGSSPDESFDVTFSAGQEGSGDVTLEAAIFEAQRRSQI